MVHAKCIKHKTPFVLHGWWVVNVCVCVFLLLVLVQGVLFILVSVSLLFMDFKLTKYGLCFDSLEPVSFPSDCDTSTMLLCSIPRR